MESPGLAYQEPIEPWNEQIEPDFRVQWRLMGRPAR